MQKPIRKFFAHFSRPLSYGILLEGGDTTNKLNRWVFMGLHAKQTLSLEGNCLKFGPKVKTLSNPAELFKLLKEALQTARVWNKRGIPFHGGWMGYWGYEFSRWCEPRLWRPPDENAVFPEFFLCEFEDWLIWDLAAQTFVCLTEDADRERQYQEAWLIIAEEDAFQEITGEQGSMQARGVIDPIVAGFVPSMNQETFEKAVAGIQDKIQAGEIYQANLSVRFEKKLALDPYAIYESLCQTNPSPFSAFLKWPEGVILSNSPERLVELDPAGQVQTRPIAGTRGRGQSPQEDEDIGERLRADEKEKAEHLMLVDLERNDLGRVCLPGSVEVDELLILERYSHVTHLVSNVKGQLKPGLNGMDVLKALFPGGTITGCPKIRCMQILRTFEPVGRGPYTGSLGYIDQATGAMDLNILIRSVFLCPTGETQGEDFVYNTAIQVGAGIVADSIGAFEYRECLRKAAATLGVLTTYEHHAAK